MIGRPKREIGLPVQLMEISAIAQLPDFDLSTIEPVKRNSALQQRVDDKVREYFKTYSISLNDQVTDRLAQALANVVSRLTPNRLNNMRITYLLFGSPLAYVFPAGVGHVVYIPDMSQSPIATT